MTLMLVTEPLVFGDGGKVIYIKTNSTKMNIYRGKIVQMVLGWIWITLKDGTKTHQFKVNSNTEVVDGKEVFLADLKIGQEVTVIAQGDLALVISSGEVKEKSVEVY